MSVADQVRRRLHSDTGYYEPRPEPDEVDLRAVEATHAVSLEKRLGNELIAERVRDPAAETVQFLCECGSAACVGRVAMTLQNYERLSRFGFVGGRDCLPEPRLLRA